MFSTIGIIIDIAIVLALVVFGLIGLKKGFLHSILSLFSWSVCIIIAVLVAKYVSGWINGIYDVSALIGGKIEGSLLSSNEFFATAVNSGAERRCGTAAYLGGRRGVFDIRSRYQ